MSKKNKSSMQKHKEKYDLFMFELDDALEALITQVKKFDKPDLLPLDYSIESLDRIERSFDVVLDGVERVDDLDVFATRVGRYLGEVLRKTVGGRWALCEEPKNIAYGLPWITDLKGLPGFGWSPLNVVFNYRSSRRSGLLKSAAQTVVNAASKAT